MLMEGIDRGLDNKHTWKKSSWMMWHGSFGTRAVTSQSTNVQCIGEGGQVSFAARPSHWRYTPKKSCPVVSQAKAGNSLGSLQLPWDWTHSGQNFPWLSKTLRFRVMVVYLSMYVEMMLFALLRVKETSG
ncbi:hypothetical protein TNCV_4452151 [Trichonephila clavipes]|nr:hypothetical protein TNCV_4452151 [Trichonephila clavipes]